MFGSSYSDNGSWKRLSGIVCYYASCYGRTLRRLRGRLRGFLGLMVLGVYGMITPPPMAESSTKKPKALIWSVFISLLFVLF